MFADDTTLSIFHEDILKLRTFCLEDLSALSLWCDLNLLTLNASKTGYVLFSSHNKRIPDHFPTENLPANDPQVTKTNKKKQQRQKNCTTQLVKQQLKLKQPTLPTPSHT
eukprot:Lithocolla_globosa_v1_NODE_349_length_4370_cov_18.560371.p6 type:complete len:110 gc:universal NODE_349_length_4370_cov_18.560371:3293-3622(+)